MNETRRFPPPWTVDRQAEGSFIVRDANGLRLATVYCRDDMQTWSYGYSHLTSDEARRIALGIARLPELLSKLPAFKARCDAPRPHRYCAPERPYHVALEDAYVRRNYDDIVAICRHNNMPFDFTGERIQRSGSLWCVYCFANQFQAAQFWRHFDGRWMVGDEFFHPKPSAGLPPLRMPRRLPNAGRKTVRD